MPSCSLYSEQVRSPEELALRVLRSVLAPADVRVVSGDDQGHVVLEPPRGSPLQVQLGWAGAGFPRDVDRAMGSLRRDGTAPLIIAARSLSPGARAILDDQQVSWLTETGAARLRLGGILVERDGRAPSKVPPPRGDEPRWAPAIAGVAEVVLAAYVDTRVDVVPSTASLASRSGRSLGSVSAALQEFDRSGWTQPPPVRRGPSARRLLVDAPAMLDSWAAWVSLRDRVVRYHAVHREPERTARDLQQAFAGDVAFGGRLAADLVAPFSSSVRTLRCYLSDSIDDVDRADRLAAARLTQSDDSSRVEILGAPLSTMSTVGRHEGLTIVSPVRIYADLLRDGVRGEEAARHLRDVAVGF